MNLNIKQLISLVCLFSSLIIFSNAIAASASSPQYKGSPQTTQPSANVDVDPLIQSAIESSGQASVIISLADHSVSDLASKQNRSELASDQNKLVQDLDLDEKQTTNYSRIPAIATVVDYSQLQDLKNDPKIESVHLQKFFSTAELQSTTGLASHANQPTLVRPALSDAVELLGAQSSWNSSGSITGQNKSVVIIDSGVDSSHPFLNGAVIAEQCFAQGPNGAQSGGDCPNGLDSQSGSGSATPCTSTSECAHGTHVAGIAAGRQGVSGAPTGGIAPQANIISIQVFSTYTDDDLNWWNEPMCASSGAESPCILTGESDVLSALNYVLSNRSGVAAINLSLGGGVNSQVCDSASPQVTSAISQLRDESGILTIVASGNGASASGISWPACISSAVAVGATTKADKVDTAYSNSSDLINLWAPGRSIRSSVPITFDGDSNRDGYTSKTGTSMATPMITGAVALLRQAYPNESATQILYRLETSGVAITDTRNNVTRHRPNVLEAIQSTGIYSGLVRTLANPSVYLINGDKKYSIGSMGIYTDFYPIGALQFVSQSYIDKFEMAGPLSRVVGSTQNSNLYLINAGIRLPFSSCSQVQEFGFSCTNVIKLTPAQLNAFYGGPGVTQFLKSTGSSTVYYVMGGKKRAIASWGDLIGLGKPFVINVFTDDLLASVQMGDLLFGGGGLIKSVNSSTVYAVNDWDTSPSMFPVTTFNNTIELGLGTNVRVVPDSQLAQYSVGPYLKTTIKCTDKYYVAIDSAMYEVPTSMFGDYGYTQSDFIVGGSICNRLTFSSKTVTKFILNRGSIYYIQDGMKKGFTSYNAYLQNGGTSANTIVASNFFADRLPNGPFINSQ